MIDPTIFAIDFAKRTGVAIHRPGELVIQTAEVEVTSPVEFVKVLYDLANSFDEVSIEFYIEELNHFRNAKTVRNLLTGAGYLYWELYKSWPVYFINTASIRSNLKCKNKAAVFEKLKQRVREPDTSIKFTNNHSDAVALALYALKMPAEAIEIDILGRLEDVG